MSEFRNINEITGRMTHGNPISLPPGTVTVGENFETVRDNVYRKPRGRNTYGSGLPSANVNQLLSYKDRLICHMSNNTLYYDSDGSGTFSQYSDIDAGTTFNAPESGYLIQGLENAGNLYITTDEGIQKLDSLSGNIEKAGIPRALGFDAELTGATGWFATGKAVAYRIVWKKTDANSNEVIGAPSERQTIVNSVGDRNVALRIYIPDGITTSHYMQIHRTSTVASSVTPPEDFQLVYQAQPTAGEITAGAMAVTDVLAADFRGTSLYTNTTQQGIQKAKYRPPKANSITEYKGYVFYGNIENEHRLYSALISVSDLTAGTSTVTVADGTNTLTLGCVADIADKTILSVSDQGGLVEVKTTAAHGYTSGDYVRFVNVTGAGGLPEAIEGKVYEVTVTSADEFTIDQAWVAGYSASGGTVDFYEDIGATPRFVIHSGGSTSQNIDDTARSIVRTINQASGNSTWYSFYESGYDDVVGKFMIMTRDVGEDQFYLTANSSDTGSEFTPAIPTTGTDYKSLNDDFQNAIMWSEKDEGEAVPLINIKKIGSADDPVLKVVGLRDSLFIIKQKDGILRLTGESDSTFNIDEFDGTVECEQINSIAKGQNAIFLFSTLGYAKISDVGVEVIGRANEFKDLKPRFSTNFSTDGYGWFYEQEKSYFISTHEGTTSTSNDIAHVYNTFTQSWMQKKHGVYTNDSNIGCAKVIDGVMYSAPVTGNELLKERKDFTTTDFQSPDIDNTISSIDTDDNIITFGSSVTIPAESIIRQGNIYRYVSEVISGTQAELYSVNNLAVNISLNVSNCADNGSGLIRVTTSAAHGLSTGNSLEIASVVGTTEANGTWTIDVVDSTNFDLRDSAFSNAYVSGGTVTNPITIIPGIVSRLKFQSIHCGLPEYDKDFKEFNLFFDNDETSVGNVTLKTSTDADTDEVETTMFEQSDDGWGAYEWGYIWGSLLETARMRTLIPEEHNRGSFLNVEIEHKRPREQCAICGYSVIFEVTDTRYQK